MHTEAAAVQVREAGLTDLPAITEMYNEEVLNGVATFDTQPVSIEERSLWLSRHGGRYPVWVAMEGHEVVAWGSLSRWSERAAYDLTAEVSVYVRRNHQGRGIGTQLFAHMVEAAPALGLHLLISRITQGNDTSIRLHERFGFRTVGVLHEVGNKFGRWLDVTIMEKLL